MKGVKCYELFGEMELRNNAYIFIYVGYKSDSGYSDRRLSPRLHLYAVSFSKTLNPHCFS